MDARQLQLFKRITLDYFAKLSPADEPVLEAPYLQFGEPALLDYASLVRIRGEYEGCLVLTSPVTLLHSLLDVHGEAEVSERTLRLPPSAFVMPIRWRGSTALLVVGLEPAAENGG